MYLYIVIVAIVAVIIGLILALCTKKAEGVVYGKLDKAGRISNIVLIPVYAVLSKFCIGIGIFRYPGYEGFLRILGWIVAVIIPSAPLFCFCGLGLSAALRKKRQKQAELCRSVYRFCRCCAFRSSVLCLLRKLVELPKLKKVCDLSILMTD